MNIRAQIFGGSARTETPLLKSKKPKGAKADELHSVSVARESRLRGDSRGEDRHRLIQERARLTYNGEMLEVDLINLSGGGAMIEAPFEALLWERVHLHLGEHGDIECAVRWIRDGRIGLEFAHETRLDCANDEMAALLRDVISHSFPELDFPLEEISTFEPATADENADEHRAAPRHPLIWTGTLYHDFDTAAARIRNISATGAMIECSMPVEVGAKPLLELSDSVHLSATVRWTVGDQIGLSFDRPFDMSQLSNSRPLELAAQKPRSYLELVADAAEAGIDHWDRVEISRLRQELEGFLKR